MNTKKNIITIAINIFCYALCYAQQIQPTPKQWLGVEQKMIKSCAYIFEGKVIQQKNFQWRDRLLQCNVIQITKIYKGTPEINLGTIKIIQWNGELTNGTVSDYYGIALNKGQSYIIFGTPDYSNVLDSLVTDNKINLTAQDEPIAFVGVTAQWGITHYKTLDELYAFLKDNGLTVQQEQKK